MGVEQVVAADGDVDEDDLRARKALRGVENFPGRTRYARDQFRERQGRNQVVVVGLLTGGNQIRRCPGSIAVTS